MAAACVAAMAAALVGWLALSPLIAGCTRRAAGPGPPGSAAAASPQPVPRYPALVAGTRPGSDVRRMGAADRTRLLPIAEESAVASFERTIGRKLAINNFYTVLDGTDADRNGAVGSAAMARSL